MQDAIICLTLLAYQHEGLRLTDIVQLVGSMQLQLRKEPGPLWRRPAFNIWEAWLKEARDRAALHPSPAVGEMEQTQSEANWQAPPLHLLQQDDEQDMQRLCQLLRRSGAMIRYYVLQLVLPRVMDHCSFKLSACGQELSSPHLFHSRLGFSGTPGTTLPRQLGASVWEAGSEGRMIHTLSLPSVVSSCAVPPGWDVQQLLRTVATHQPPLSALIDTGALITGLNNKEVALLLLQFLPSSVRGVVFLDETDRAVVLPRGASTRTQPTLLQMSGLDASQRFTFFDQVHTTGIDIPHATQATAAVTLGKDISLRDYVQGAWRMRRLGLGQRITLLMIPEISLSVHNVSNTGAMARDVLTWLASNTVHFEQLQQCKLLQQDMQALWRERGMQHLLRPLQAKGAAASTPGSAVVEEECGICMHKRELVPLRPCLHRVCPPCRARISTIVRADEEPRCPFCRVQVVTEVEQLDRDLGERQRLAGLFLEPLDFDVPDHWPTRHSLLQQLQAEAKQRSNMIANAAAVTELLQRAEEMDLTVLEGEDELRLDAEVTQEHEQEQEVQIQALETKRLVRGFVKQKNGVRPWRLDTMSQPALAVSHGHIFPLSAFATSALPVQLQVPAGVFLSWNHTCTHFDETRPRCIRNTTLALRVQPGSDLHSSFSNGHESLDCSEICVALSLNEAQSICALLLQSWQSSWSPALRAALVLVGDGTMVCHSKDFALGEGESSHVRLCRQYLRFFDCEQHFESRDGEELVSSMLSQGNKLLDLHIFFRCMQSCRRRDVDPMQSRCLLLSHTVNSDSSLQDTSEACGHVG